MIFEDNTGSGAEDDVVSRWLDERLRMARSSESVPSLAFVELAHEYKQLQQRLQRLQRISDRNQEQLARVREECRSRVDRVERNLGKFVPEQVLREIADCPDTVTVGGDRRLVTVMMADLRGFSAQSEILSPEAVVDILARFFDSMAEAIQAHGGTIIEFLGDSLLVVFGAPRANVDDAVQAVACAVQMQQNMTGVNALNRRDGWPELSMGIGIHTGEVISGNIGARSRLKYAVVGRTVNLAARIESYTAGGQIYISEECRRACGNLVHVRESLEVAPKGASEPIQIHLVAGVGGRFGFKLEVDLPELEPFSLQQSVWVQLVSGKHNTRTNVSGSLIRYGNRAAEIRLDSRSIIPRFTDLKLVLQAPLTTDLAVEMYAKVISEERNTNVIQFTLLPDQLVEHFEALVIPMSAHATFHADLSLDLG